MKKKGERKNCKLITVLLIIFSLIQNYVFLVQYHFIHNVIKLQLQFKGHFL